MIDASLLSSLRHSNVTNLSVGKISNHDAALLIIAASPAAIAKSSQVAAGLRSWRGSNHLHFTYLWNTSGYGGYGFVGRNFGSASNPVSHHAPRGSGRPDCVTRRRTYWYRLKPGTYTLTLEGIRRLAELTTQLSHP